MLFSFLKKSKNSVDKRENPPQPGGALMVRRPDYSELQGAVISQKSFRV